MTAQHSWSGKATHIVDAEVYTTEDLERLALPEERDPMNYGAILGRLTRAMMAARGRRLPQRRRRRHRHRAGLADRHAGPRHEGRCSSAQATHLSRRRLRRLKGIRPPYFDLRSQMFYMWSQDITNAQAFFYADMPHLSSLKKELQLHEADDTPKVMRVIPKDELKLMLGKSPDIADAAVLVMPCE